MSDTTVNPITDDGTLENVPNTLLFGILGIGTFIVFFFLFLIAVACCFTIPCPTPIRYGVRGGLFLILFIIVIILIFAEHDTWTHNSSMVPPIYDHSIIPRVCVSLMMCIFAIVAVVNLVEMGTESKQLSSIDRDLTELWQDR